MTNPKSTEPAERVPDADLEYPLAEVEDQSLATRWCNPEDRDWVGEVYVGIVHGRRPTTHDEKYGTKTFRIKAGQTRAIPAEYDLAIQQIECEHPACATKKRLCQRFEHAKSWKIVGGLGPRLIREGVQKLRLAPGLQSEEERLAPPSRATEAPVTATAEEAALRRAAERLAK